MLMPAINDQARAITVVLHDLPLGGSERIAVRLANRWAAAGRQVTILVGARQGPLGDLIDPAVSVVECSPAIPRAKGSRRRLGAAAAAHLKNNPADILFVPGNYHWPVMHVIGAMSKATRPGLVAQVGTPLFRHGRKGLKQLAYTVRTRLQFRRVDAAISLSDAMTADVDRVLGRQITQRIALPALGDEGDDGAPVAASGRLIVAAGRLVPEKGFDVAIRAFAALADRSARLAILGEGPEHGNLVALAQAQGVADRVDFPGYVRDIRPWLDRSRLFLLSSWYEGYAAVVIEALAAGRPVVATDCTPAAYELLTSYAAGAVAPLGDIAGLAEAMNRVINAPAPCPRALAASVAEYRIGPIAEAYLRHFDEVKTARTAAPAPKAFSLSALWPSAAFASGRATGLRPTYAGALHPAE
jgi:glycosyltransferase involved in cell wall biosynthesis